MRGSRVAEVVQRPPNRAPASSTSSSNSDPLRSRARIEKSPKVSPSETPSPRISSFSNPKKLGTRIADLESQLGLAQEELKCLKDQLSSTDVVKKAAHNQLKSAKKQDKLHSAVEVEDKSFGIQIDASNKDRHEAVGDAFFKADICEVPAEEAAIEPVDEEPVKDEISILKASLERKNRDLELLSLQNRNLVSQLEEKSAKILTAQSEINELKIKLADAEQELDKSRSTVMQINSRMEVVERARVEMDDEMKRLTVHTEQWKKAADAAAAVLAAGADANCRKISERCGSMDAHGINPLGYAMGSPAMIDDPQNVFDSEKRKASGIRMLGDMLKKKGQK